MSYIGQKSNSRTKWAIKPVTQVKQSKKAYSRGKTKREAKSIILDSIAR